MKQESAANATDKANSSIQEVQTFVASSSKQYSSVSGIKSDNHTKYEKKTTTQVR